MLFTGGNKDQDQGGPPSVNQLSAEIEALRIRNSALLRDLEEVMESRDEKAKENAAMAAKLDQTEKELKHAKEALVGESCFFPISEVHDWRTARS